MSATYFVLNLVFMAVIIAVFKLRFPKPWRVMLIPLGILLLFTLVFDNLMIFLQLFSYAPEHISGLKLGLAPVEDFMYPLLAFLLVPTLWSRFASPTTPIKGAKRAAKEDSDE